MTWQDIETAPKTNKIILIKDAGAAVRTLKLVSWSKGSDSWVDYNGVKIIHATHWFPFPDPPITPKMTKRHIKKRLFAERDAKIVAQMHNKESTWKVAADYGISTSRVWQIVKKHEMRQEWLKQRGKA